MSLTNPEKVVTEERLSQFYGSILPYLGGMPEAIANKFSKGDLYSTDEKMIGQWIDGKPLYQKTVNFGALPNKTTKTLAHGISNIATVVKIEVLASRDSQNTWVQLPIVNDSNVNYQCGIQVVGENLVSESRKVDFSSFTAYVTITYTKTTDSAISIGSDTDYSTTEKIVGTWIDGKPLYECSFTGTVPTTSGRGSGASANLGTISDLQSIAKIEAIIGKDGLWRPLQYCYDTANSVSGQTRLPWTLVYVYNSAIMISNGETSTNGASCVVTVQYTKTAN